MSPQSINDQGALEALAVTADNTPEILHESSGNASNGWVRQFAGGDSNVWARVEIFVYMSWNQDLYIWPNTGTAYFSIFEMKDTAAQTRTLTIDPGRTGKIYTKTNGPVNLNLSLHAHPRGSKEMVGMVQAVSNERTQFGTFRLIGEDNIRIGSYTGQTGPFSVRALGWRKQP